MGTRSLTIVLDEDREVMSMYRQFDGYPDGHGLELANFIKDILIVNGIRGDEPENFANGPGCLAAQIVAHFKEGPGNIYLYPAHKGKSFVSYIYTITTKTGEYPSLKCQYGYDDGVLFDGMASDFTGEIEEEDW